MRDRHWGGGRADGDERGFRGFARGGRDFSSGSFGHRRGREGRRGHGRVFDQGDLRLVILDLIAKKPSYGYELIKAIEEALGGAYTPSPGVVYPTLTLLEEMGLATVETSDSGRKLYTITDAGRAELEARKVDVDGITQRVADVRARSGDMQPQVIRAMENLHTALRLRLAKDRLSDDQARAVAETLDAAALSIERI